MLLLVNNLSPKVLWAKYNVVETWMLIPNMKNWCIDFPNCFVYKMINDWKKYKDFSVPDIESIMHISLSLSQSFRIPRFSYFYTSFMPHETIQKNFSQHFTRTSSNLEQYQDWRHRMKFIFIIPQTNVFKINIKRQNSIKRIKSFFLGI